GAKHAERACPGTSAEAPGHARCALFAPATLSPLGEPWWRSARSLSIRNAEKLAGEGEVVLKSVGMRPVDGHVVDDQGDFRLMHGAMSAEGWRQGFELAIGFAEDRLLVAEDDELADPLGHQVEPLRRFRPGEDLVDAFEAPDDLRGPGGVFRGFQPDPGRP